MVMMAKLDLPSRFIRQQMASVIHLLVQTARLSDGMRRVTHIAEVTGMDDLNIEVRDIFFFEQTGVSEDGRVLGRFRGSSPSEEFVERLKLGGTPVSEDLFQDIVTVG
jgi:pilus assembly protein CpaF